MVILKNVFDLTKKALLLSFPPAIHHSSHPGNIFSMQIKFPTNKGHVGFHVLGVEPAQ